MIHAIFVTTLIASNTVVPQERLPIELVPTMTLPTLDYVSLEEEDLQRDTAGLPLRFAVPNSVSVTPATHGIWEHLDGNKVRWTYHVTCDNAMSMNVGFARYNMPSTGSMTIMDLSIGCQIRAFTSEDNKDHGELWTPIIPSNQAVIEIIVDRSEKELVSQNI